MTDAARGGASAADSEPRDERARGRELALLALCHLESYPPGEHEEALGLLWQSPPQADARHGTWLVELVRDPAVQRRAEAFVRGLMGRWAEIDGTISETSARWRLDRMAQVDRNVLRLARRYGSERSAGFVNGVAEALARRLRPRTEAGPAAAGTVPQTEGDG